MSDTLHSVTYLFTDIEGSTRLWETEPARMKPALARHDALARSAVEDHQGVVVKMTGDGVHAAFANASCAVRASLAIQHALSAPAAPDDLLLRIRCGLHAGVDERRDGDYFGPAVNRAARIMGAAHGGQILLSQAVAERLVDRLPEGVALRDLGAVRLRDLERPERIFQVIDPGLRAEFPALRSLEATPNNLPQQLNSFVGRERELASVKDLLRSNRLLTLLGMGGLGKSRLSIQLAAEVLDEFPDGVWLVELAALNDSRQVIQEIATVLGIKEESGRPVDEAVVKFARDRQLLVVLDNCEHLIDACANAAKLLLQSGPAIRIVATSRDYLQVAGENSYHVPPLSVPDRDADSSLDTLLGLESVHLFVDRAMAIQPAFRLNDENATAVAEICYRLDGIPLAIELAAARTRGLSVKALAERLGDRFRLLISGDRTALPRQRTLRALIDWSYDLLPKDERDLFQCLSVFAGGWTLEAAEAVGADLDTSALDVLDQLTRLVEKSLVVMEASGVRYRLLDTVRQYAQQKLSESGREAAARARHRDHFLAVAERARPELNGPSQGEWLVRLDLERDNFLTAHALGESAGQDPDVGVRLVEALRPYWLNRGLMSLWLRVTEELLARPAIAHRNQTRCRALFGAGQTCYFMGRYTEAIDFLAESLAIARETGDQKWIARILQPLGTACLGEGHLPAALAHLDEALTMARDIGNRREIAAASNALAMVHRMQGSPDDAERLYREVVALARELGDKESIAIGLLNLAIVSIDHGRVADSAPMLREVIGIAEEIGSKPAGQSALEVCAGLACARGNWRVAARFYGAAEAQMAMTGLQRDPADEAFLAPWIDRARIALGAQEFEASTAIGRTNRLGEGLAAARAWLDESATFDDSAIRSRSLDQL